MAYIPDEAIERMTEITGNAFKMYAYFCRRRNAMNGLSFPSLKTIAADCGINYCYASEIRSELVKKGWVEILEKRFINCLVGFGKSKDSLENPKISDQKEFGKSKNPLEFPKVSLEIPNITLENPNIYLENPNSPLKELTSPINQPNITSPINQKEKEQKRENAKIILPEDFPVSEEMRVWAKEHAPDVDLDRELPEFITFWREIATRNHRRTLRGWVATWQNRMRDIQAKIEEKRNGTHRNGTQNGAGRKPTPAETFASYGYYD